MYVPNTGAANSIRQTPMDTKGQTSPDALIVDADFSYALSSLDRSS